MFEGHPRSINELKIGEFYSHDDVYTLSEIFAYSQNESIILIRASNQVLELLDCHNDWYQVLAKYEELSS